MFSVRTLDEVVSTNEEVKRAIADDRPEGLVVRAHRQSGGYGRDGRRWESPLGGLYFSMLLRPDVDACQLSTLPLVVGLAVREALGEFVSADMFSAVQIKWPNDIVLVGAAMQPESEATQPERAAMQPELEKRAAMCSEPVERASERGERPLVKKLCGISAEAHDGAVCVGVGVNVKRPQIMPTVQGKNSPVYLAEIASESAASFQDGALQTQVLEAILRHFEPSYRRWKEEGFAPFAPLCNACFALAGVRVAILDRAGRELASGQACGVDGQGFLLLEDAAGITRAISTGEAHIQL